jgi:hypothetical protein
MVFRAVPTRIAGGPTWLGSAQAAAPRRAGAPARFSANAGWTSSSHARVWKRRQCGAAGSAHGLPELASTCQVPSGLRRPAEALFLRGKGRAGRSLAGAHAVRERWPNSALGARRGARRPCHVIARGQ